MDQLGLLVWLLFLAVFVYFLMIRPARNRQRQALQIQNSLRPGLEVMTTTGLFGTVSAITDDEVVLEVAPGVLNRYAKGAVARIVTPQDQAEGAAEGAARDEDGPGTTGGTTGGPPAG